MTSPQFLGAKIHIFQKRNLIHLKTFFSFKTLLMRLSQTCWDTLYVHHILNHNGRLTAFHLGQNVKEFCAKMFTHEAVNDIVHGGIQN